MFSTESLLQKQNSLMRKTFLIALLGLCASSLLLGGQWRSIVTGGELALSIASPINGRSNATIPVIIYLKNLAAPRVGTENDEVNI